MNHPVRRAENAPRQLSIGCEIGGAASLPPSTNGAGPTPNAWCCACMP